MRPGWTLFLFLAALSLSLAAPLEAEEGAGARIGTLQGRAFELSATDRSQIKSLESSDYLSVPTTVRVEQGGHLGLTFPDNSVFRLAGPGMLRLVESVTVGPERVFVLEMSLGEAWLALRSFPGEVDDVEIVLPAVSLITKRAQCRIRVASDRRCVLAVVSGQVTVRRHLDVEDGTGDMVRKDPAEYMGEQKENGRVKTNGSREKVFKAGELVRIGLNGGLSDVEVVDEASLRDDAWVLWNMAQDRKERVFVQENLEPAWIE